MGSREGRNNGRETLVTPSKAGPLSIGPPLGAAREHSREDWKKAGFERNPQGHPGFPQLRTGLRDWISS